MAVVFLAAALLRATRDGGFGHAQTKTWLLVGVIFAIVSARLWS
jgi:prolipoprotein diacylglyceryltransferase